MEIRRDHDDFIIDTSNDRMAIHDIEEIIEKYEKKKKDGSLKVLRVITRD